MTATIVDDVDFFLVVGIDRYSFYEKIKVIIKAYRKTSASSVSILRRVDEISRAKRSLFIPAIRSFQRLI
jgi:hypothetical protein